MGVSAVVGGAIIGGVATASAADKQASAAKKSAQLQAQSSDKALALQEKLNQPYLKLGESAVNNFSDLLNDPYGASYLENNPLFQKAVDYTSGQLKQAGAAAGKLNSGETINQLFNNYLATGENYFNNAYNRALIPVQIGQNAANFQGVNSAGLITDAGAANAAGQIGTANAYSAGLNNLSGITTNALSSYAMLNQQQPQQSSYGSMDYSNALF